MNNIFHKGEKYIQEKMGVRKSSDSLSSMIKNTIPLIASDFLENLSFCCVVINTCSEDLYTFSVYNIDKFIDVINDKEILINLDYSTYIPIGLKEKPLINIGFIGLDFEKRMRIRINGQGRVTNNKLTININEIYSNCPKYISKKYLNTKLKESKIKTIVLKDKIDSELENIILNSDTFFISSSHKEKGLDISYKGGEKGFLKVLSNNKLEFYDLPGNNFFNTIGNIYTNPYVNVFIIDFDNTETYHIKAKANISGEKKQRIILECNEIILNKNAFLLDYK